LLPRDHARMLCSKSACALLPRIAHADLIVFQDRVAFTAALQSNPSLVTTVEGWDTYRRTIFSNGSTVNGITYNVSAGEALVVNTGISFRTICIKPCAPPRKRVYFVRSWIRLRLGSASRFARLGLRSVALSPITTATTC
jgi:hypothetical protein